MTEHILLRHRDIPKIDQLKIYRRHGGFKAFETAVRKQTPQQIVDLVKASGLRGRGGAGFPTGVKWGFLTPGVFPRYVVANADESEPGTFKDREILERNPFQFLEGVAICAYAAQARVAYVYCRGEFWDLTALLDEKIEQLKAEKLLGQALFATDYSLDIRTHLGAGAYICGEETALLEALEGKLGQPRLRPPFPAAVGLYGQPTVVNNVETLANLPPILARGADWYRSIGTERSTGPKIFSLSGHVERPGNYELPLGTPFRELIFERGGGIPKGRAIKAILPAGASAPILPASDAVLDTGMDYESVAGVGSALGSASIIVLDDTVDIAWAQAKISRFFAHESCGKCTPCRIGTMQFHSILSMLLESHGRARDLEHLQDVGRLLKTSSICGLGQSAPNAVLSGLRHFRGEFERLVEPGFVSSAVAGSPRD